MSEVIAMSNPVEKRPLLKTLAPWAALFAFIVFAMIFLRDVFTVETLRENREALLAWRDQNYLFAALAYVAFYIVVVALSLPVGLPTTLAGGFLFGFVGGTLLTVIGATLGAVLIFLAASTSLRRIFEERAGPWRSKVEAGLRENEISYLFLMRLAPVVPFFVANLLPAMFGVGFWTFVLTTFFGIMPGTAAFSYAGSGIGEVFDRGEAFSFSLFSDPAIYGPLLALIALAALPIAVKAVLGKRGGR